jgi:hypothetical protein
VFVDGTYDLKTKTWSSFDDEDNPLTGRKNKNTPRVEALDVAANLKTGSI